jgi:hypothetical protein
VEEAAFLVHHARAWCDVPREAVRVKPYFKSDTITLFHADCRDALAGLPSGSVDVLLTDPPYGMTYEANGRSGAAIRADGSRQGMRGPSNSPPPLCLRIYSPQTFAGRLTVDCPAELPAGQCLSLAIQDSRYALVLTSP